MVASPNDAWGADAAAPGKDGCSVGRPAHLRRVGERAQRVGHPAQLRRPEPDHRRRERPQRLDPAAVLLDRRRRELGQTSLPAGRGDSFQSDPEVDWTSDGTAWALTLGVNAALTRPGSTRTRPPTTARPGRSRRSSPGRRPPPTARSSGSTTARPRRSRTRSTRSGTTARRSSSRAGPPAPAAPGRRPCR